MQTSTGFSIRAAFPQLTPGLFRELLAVFGEVFDEVATYTADQPGDDYIARSALPAAVSSLLSRCWTIPSSAVLAAYELKKFEQERSEFYIYDLAVAAEQSPQRRGDGAHQSAKGAIAASRGVLCDLRASGPDRPSGDRALHETGQARGHYCTLTSMCRKRRFTRPRI